MLKNVVHSELILSRPALLQCLRKTAIQFVSQHNSVRNYTKVCWKILQNWRALNVPYELPDDDSLRIEIFSNVECHL